MDNYSIEMPNENGKIYRIITILMLLINLVVFIFIFSGNIVPVIKWMSIAGFIINIIAIIIFFAYKKTFKKGGRGFYAIETTFIFSALCLVLTGKFFLSILLLLSAFFAFYTQKKLVIKISKAGIRYPSFPVKLFLWEQLQQVILKDDILTIDLKNNHLIQHAINNATHDIVDEKSFNNFCEQQLT